MNTHDTVRETVSDTYARAVENPNGGCCGASPAAGMPEGSKGVAVQMAGYAKDELSDLPEDALVNSFGCGNPMAFSNVKEGDVVLDLGSGAGIDLLLAAKKVGPTGRVIGVDMTDAMIEHAQRNIAEAGVDNVEVRKGLIEDLPVEDSSVDWVISNCVINLSPEKERVFAEIARVLKPGGRMAVSDIVVDTLPDWAKESAELYCSCVSGAIPEREYLAGLEAAGLTEVKVTDRMVYDAGQVAEIVRSEVGGDASAAVPAADSCCGSDAQSEAAAPAAAAGGCCGSDIENLIARAGTELEGKVWSAKVVAIKPV